MLPFGVNSNSRGLLDRYSDAIQCHQRALLGADAAQTLQILGKLAHLHNEIRDYKAAAAVHRRYVNVAEREGRNIGEMATSYLYLAQYELDLLHRPANAYQQLADDDDNVDDDNSEVLTRRPPLGQGKTSEGESRTEEDIEMAIMWLERVIASGAPEREIAEEDLRYIQRRLEMLERRRHLANSTFA